MLQNFYEILIILRCKQNYTLDTNSEMWWNGVFDPALGILSATYTFALVLNRILSYHNFLTFQITSKFIYLFIHTFQLIEYPQSHHLFSYLNLAVVFCLAEKDWNALWTIFGASLESKNGIRWGRIICFSKQQW